MPSLIASISSNNVISSGGTLPWSNVHDLARFMRITHDATVFMGRLTFAAIGTPIAGRRLCVVTSKRLPFDIPIVRSLEEGLQQLDAEQRERACIYADRRLYREGEKYCDKLFLTRIYQSIPGEAMIDFSLDGWHKVREENFMHEDPQFSFLDYQRQGW